MNYHSRREMLSTAGTGFGALPLAAILGSEGRATDAELPHRSAKATSVIFLFMEGGPSHIDLFDPKPLLRKLAGQSLPDSFEKPVTAMGEVNSPLLTDRRKWAQHGESGLWISDWLPHPATCADDLTVIRSCWSHGSNHFAPERPGSIPNRLCIVARCTLKRPRRTEREHWFGSVKNKELSVNCQCDEQTKECV
ncbi:MAG: DUF1501 domain-containing protein [Fuerstiella sp.]|nr:DUF1501 domain-containing protein [Fuerstiella sp.]